MILAAIDGGKDGAIAFSNGSFYPLPVLKGKKRDVTQVMASGTKLFGGYNVNDSALASILLSEGAKMACIEIPWVKGGNSGTMTSLFNFGRIYQTCVSLDVDTILVSAQTWQSALNLPKLEGGYKDKKQKSLIYCKAHNIYDGDSHDIADAFCMLEWLKLYHNAINN